MGLMNLSQVDNSHTLINFSNIDTFSPPAIHKSLTKEEMSERLGLYRGSGGNLSVIFSTSQTGKYNLKEQDQDCELHNPLNLALDKIRTVFSLNYDELGQVLLKTRKTIYNWLEGSISPHKGNLSRLFYLLTVAEDWEKAGFKVTSKSLHTPILGNQSVFSMLIEPVIDRDKILFSGSRLSLLSEKKSLKDPFA